jgi:antitoxin component of MazEF toxin-antitoxin module
MIHSDYERLVADAPSLSEKIRILYDAGMPKADIARFIDRRYQHVRNVIMDYEKKKAAEAGGSEGAGEEPSARAADPNIEQLMLEKGGKVRLPQAWLERQGLAEGSAIICQVDSDGLRIMSREVAVRELAAIVKRSMPREAALLETLLKEP